ncbi:Mur ligase family protein [Clostridium rectalis]|uniref:Mur ligase family protein n=1 Tax=Clostridium rectalis TaxID=2040295 RepID=UPI000F641D80|nr:Mur ligase family protein [Clostridium rectalis]
MHIFFAKYYEGNNIKYKKKLVKLGFKDSNIGEVEEFINRYLKVYSYLGCEQKLIDIEIEEGIIYVWLTYEDEEVTNYIIYNLIDKKVNETFICKNIKKFYKGGFIHKLIKQIRINGIPCIKLSNDIYQVGYGKNSIIISNEYQSYENMGKSIQFRNRRVLFDCLKYNKFLTVNALYIYDLTQLEDVKFESETYVVSNHKSDNINIICKNKDEIKRVCKNVIQMYGCAIVYGGKKSYKVLSYRGKKVIVYLKNNDSYKKIMDEKILYPIRGIIEKLYKSFKIEFFYIDIFEDVDKKLRIMDMGNIFDISGVLLELEDEAIKLIGESLKERIKSIPIITVTGTNGKTTTCRIIYNIMCKLGYNCGLASTEGIYIRSKKIKSGDTTGFLSARELLTNSEVDSCVLETARGGISRNGLGYENSKVAVITSISEDHIGMEGTKTFQDLIKVKGVVLEELDQDGLRVIKGDKVLENFFVNGIKNTCIFNIEKNQFIKSHLKKGGDALYIENNFIVYVLNGKRIKLIDISKNEFTHYGKSKSNIMNLMAALAAVYKVHKNFKDIVMAIDSITCDLKYNPGRQNIFKIKDYYLIIDYGHNREAFIENFQIAKALKPVKLTSIITGPGDRMNKYIKELGEVAANYSDYIIIREQKDLRGRNKGEVANLIKKGVINKGFSERNIEVIYKEEEAIVYAMRKAVSNEVIVLFTQCLDVIIPAINKYLREIGEEELGKGLDFSH